MINLKINLKINLNNHLRHSPSRSPSTINPINELNIKPMNEPNKPHPDSNLNQTVTGRLKTGQSWALQNRPLQGALFISENLIQARGFLNFFISAAAAAPDAITYRALS